MHIEQLVAANIPATTILSFKAGTIRHLAEEVLTSRATIKDLERKIYQLSLAYSELEAHAEELQNRYKETAPKYIDLDIS